MSNWWIKNSKLTNNQIGRIIDYFVLLVPVIKIARMLSINRHISESIYTTICINIVRECEKESLLGVEV